jgi:hypothetical protein
LLVLTTSRPPLAFFTSQPQPEPKVPMAVWLNFSLKASNEPNAWSMAAASAPLGLPPAFGARQFQ